MDKNKEIARQISIGDVYLMRFCGEGSAQQGWRPGLVFQNNVGNAYSPNIVALPLTSAVKKTCLPTHVVLPENECGLKKESMVLCENPECVPRHRVGRYLSSLPRSYMAKVAEANILASSAIAYLDPEQLGSLWEKAAILNFDREAQ